MKNAEPEQRAVMVAFRRPQPARESVIGAGILLLLICLTLAPFVFGDRTLQDSATDTASLFATGSRFPRAAEVRSYRVLDAGAPSWQTEPLLKFEHDTYATEKAPPLWTPYSAYGMPVAADMHSQPYSPFAWANEIVPSARSWNLTVALRLYAAGLFTFLFLRLFIGLMPSLVGGSAFMYAGYFWLYATMPHLSVEVLIPAVLFTTERLLRRPALDTAVALCIALSAMVLGGMPESTLLAGAFALVYALVRLRATEAFRANARRIFAFGGAAALLSGGICAVQLLPFLEYVRISRNSHAGGGVGLGYDAFSPELLGLYLAPLLHGPPWANIFHGSDIFIRGFFGSSALFLALLALGAQLDRMLGRRVRNNAPIFFFGVAASILLLKRFGVWPMSELGAIPGFSFVIFPKYEEAIIACCIAVLAGFGTAMLSERVVALHVILAAAAIPLTVLTVAAAADTAAYRALTAHQEFYILSLASGLVFLAAAVTFATLANRGTLGPLAVGVIALTCVVAEVHANYIVPLYYVLNGNASDAESALDGAPYIAFLKAHTKNGERFYGQDGILYPDWSSAFGIADVRGIDAVYPERYLPFIEAFFGSLPGVTHLDRVTGFDGLDFTGPLQRRFLQLSSVRYVGVVREQLDATPGSPFRRAFEQPGVTLYEFGEPLPRVSIYRRVVRAADGDAARSLLTSPAFDPDAEAIAEGTDAELGPLIGAPRSRVAAGLLEEYHSRDVRARIGADGTSLVVLNDTAFPGWQATIDGQPARILRANYLFRGVVVQAGSHVVGFSYRPASFTIGLLISLLSLTVLLGAAALSTGPIRIAAPRVAKLAGQLSED
jgi:hypothetical protein